MRTEPLAPPEAGPALPGPASLAAEGLRSLGRRPFRVFWGLTLFLGLVSETASESIDTAALWSALVLLVVSSYVQIATILAAGRADPEPRADPWLRGALVRRCFWRFVVTGLIAVLLVMVGLLALVIGGFVAGAIVALAQPAVVLERCLPTEAIARSARLSRKARVPVGVVFGAMVLAPLLLGQAAYQFGWADALGPAWVGVTLLFVSLTLAGTIALTRAYVLLGGSATPAFGELGLRRNGGGVGSR